MDNSLTLAVEEIVKKVTINVQDLPPFNLTTELSSLDPRILKSVLSDVARASSYISSEVAAFSNVSTAIHISYLRAEEEYLSALAEAMMSLPPGVSYMLENKKCPDMEFKIVYIDCPVAKRIRNMMRRGDSFFSALKRVWVDLWGFRGVYKLNPIILKI